MRTGSGRLRSHYGASGMHLLLMLGSFALAAYVISVLGPANLWDPKVWWQSILVWFLGAVIAHDLILFPIYALGDRVLSGSLRTVRDRRGEVRPRVSALNHIRVPILATGLLFLLFFPGIISQGAGSYLAATGQTQDPFLERWLLLSAAIFAVSAVVYVVRRRFTQTAE